MPFITQDRREIIDNQGIFKLSTVTPGDKCYVFYRAMVDQWNDNPRWHTAHSLYKNALFNFKTDPDDIVAHSLAWQVFFQLHVMPYELKKREENGDI
jgi:hypothetical protein